MSASVAPMPTGPSHAVADPFPESARAPFPDRLAAFTFFWAGYILLCQGTTYYHWFQFSNRLRLVYGAAVAGLALWAMLRPSSILRLSLAMGALLYVKWRGMPNHANHTLLALLICLTLLAVFARHLLRPRAARLTPDWRAAVYDEAAALVRLEVLAMYFYVVLHKLNFDYFNPDVSCGAVLYQEITQRYAFMPQGDWVRLPGIIGALMFEAAIPVLLVFRRTRAVGLLVGMAFHLLLSLHENVFIYDFSAMLYALYLLFLPDELFVRLRDAWQASGLRRTVDRLRGWRGWAAGAAVAVLVAATLAVGSRLIVGRVSRDGLIEALHRIAPVAQHYAWYVLALVAIGLVARAVLRHRRDARGADPSAYHPTTAGLFRPALTPLLVLPVIVFLNGLCPYVGLKTESAFAMFANLRTEGGRTNHLFMPVGFRVADYQEDLVQPLRSTDKVLQALADANEGLPYLEFRRRLARVMDPGSPAADPNFSVTYRRGTEERTVTRREHAGEEMFQPLPYWQRKFLHFRTVQMWDGPELCGH